MFKEFADDKHKEQAEEFIFSVGRFVIAFERVCDAMRVNVRLILRRQGLNNQGMQNVIIGDNVRIANGVNIYEGTVIKDRVFLGNNVSFTNVRYPRAWRKANQFMATVIEEDATVNANAVITAGVRVGRGATVGDGAIVVNNVSDGGMVVSPKAECICEREECAECSKRKERNLRKHIKYGKS